MMVRGCLLYGLIGAVLLAGQAGAQQPNIVFIMADDLGWADTSNALTTMGQPSDFYETPMLEVLAAQGMAFTHAYANPTCAPTRTAILSGAYAPRASNGVYQVGSLDPTTNTLLAGVDQGSSIPRSTVTHAETLQSAGYTTGYVGKFHVADTINEIVAEHGFDVNIGGATTGAPGDYFPSNGRYGNPVSPTMDAYAADYTQQYVDDFIKPFTTDLPAHEAAIDALVGTAKHLTDASTDAAIDFITSSAAQPFFLQFSPHAVHTPIDASQARPDLLTKYEAKPAGSGASSASYAAILEGLDQGIARLIDTLQTTPDPRNAGQMLDQNTLVVFYSDNGGLDGAANLGPLSGSKSDLNEGGLRVPMIAWSANDALVEGGTVTDQIVLPIDFYQTFTELAGAALPSGQVFDGIDLSGMFADSAAQIDRGAVFWHFPGNLRGGRNEGPQSAIRKRIGETDWKLTYSYDDQSWELYDLDSDIGEANNRAVAEQDLRLLLGFELLRWLDETDAPLATVRSGSIQVILTEAMYGYADGAITAYLPQTLSFDAGQAMPLFTTRIPGDTDFDADIDDADIANAFSHYTGPLGFGVGGKTLDDGDTDGDGDIDDADLGTLFAGYTGPLSPASVPEPATSIMLGWVATAMLRRPRR